MPGWQRLELAGTGIPGPAAARRWTGARLTALGPAHRVDALLLAGELLDNAHLHGGGALQLRLHHARCPCEVTFEVADAGTGRPRLRVPDRTGGRGRWLVEELAEAWGVGHHDDGKLVWARLPCAGSDQPCPPPDAR